MGAQATAPAPPAGATAPAAPAVLAAPAMPAVPAAPATPAAACMVSIGSGSSSAAGVLVEEAVVQEDLLVVL